MNLKQHLRERAATRYLLVAIGSLVTAGFLGGLSAVILVAIGLVLVPPAVCLTAYYWAHTVEWTRLSIAEEYGAAAQKRLEEAARNDLRRTLDPIGVEALEEVERAIQRREEDRANQ